jgi:hypothetical protein
LPKLGTRRKRHEEVVYRSARSEHDRVRDLDSIDCTNKVKTMPLNIKCSSNIDFQAAVVKKLNAYESRSGEFKIRRLNSFTVDIKWSSRMYSGTGGHVKGVAQGNAITITVPKFWPTCPDDLLKEVAETILFECGNAQRAKAYSNLDKQLSVPIITFGKNKAKIELNNDFEFLNALMITNGRGQSPSTSNQKRLGKYMRVLRDEDRFVDKAGGTQHTTTSKLSTRDLYAYERVSRCRSDTSLISVLLGLINTTKDAYKDFIKTSGGFLNKDEYIAFYFTILTIVKSPLSPWFTDYQGDDQCMFTDEMIAQAKDGETLPAENRVVISRLTPQTISNIHDGIDYCNKIANNKQELKNLVRANPFI